MKKTTSGHLALVAGLAMLTLAALPTSTTYGKTVTVDGGELELRNLIGEIRVEAARGSSFEVEVDVQGDDASRADIRVDVDGHRVNVVFPVGDERNYVYPPMGRGSETNFSFEEGGFWSKISGGNRVRVKGSGSGMEVWADVIIRVPDGGDLEVFHGVGSITARDVRGSLVLDISSGKVEVSDIDGDVLVDTGSGHVEMRNVAGNVDIDTGSGHVEASGLDGRRVVIDTGSGAVELSNIRCQELVVDTGSGAVTAERLAADDVEVDTGSGRVQLVMNEMGNGDISIDTGSGGIRLDLPGTVSASIDAETGSGGISLDFDGARVLHQERDEMKAEIGGGGSRVRLSTGSGGIRIGQS